MEYDALRGVQVVGKVKRIDDPARVLSIGRQIYDRYFDRPGTDIPGVVLMAKKRVAFLVQPQRVRTWDHRRPVG